MFIIEKVKTWLIVAGGVILAMGSALVWGYFKGKDRQKKTARVVAAKVNKHNAEVRKNVEMETGKLEDAGKQKVGEADPGTATGRLRRMWMRSSGGKG